MTVALVTADQPRPIRYTGRDGVVIDLVTGEALTDAEVQDKAGLLSRLALSFSVVGARRHARLYAWDGFDLCVAHRDATNSRRAGVSPHASDRRAVGV